ncbi:MAG: CHAT domain-containing protein [Prochlorothrix sp.]
MFNRFGQSVAAAVIGVYGLGNSGVLAQVTPAIDGTQTQVQITDQGYGISGGTQVGGNLFHSFEQFNLDRGQTAQFQTPGSIANVLGRIIGGDPSYIDGTLSLVGSNANLYLINPAGLVFGNGAQLQLPGSFTATTATGIGFDLGTFHSFGPNSWASLSGSPQSLLFNALGTQGTVFNGGNLAVHPGASLTLVGGAVVNTGTLAAPGGTITLLAVGEPGTVQLSQAGFVLSLQVQNPDLATALAPDRTPSSFNPLQLPQLLTGGFLDHATDLVISPEGRVFLQDTPESLAIAPGSTAIAGQLSASSATGTGGQIQVLGQRVSLADATLQANGPTGGGQIYIGGDYQGEGLTPTAQLTWVDGESVLTANAIDDGNGGKVIVWAEGKTGFWGSIEAEGGENGGDGGFVEVSGYNHLIFQGQVSTAAPQGRTGTLLLDPTDILVQATPSNTPLTGVDDFADPDQGSPTIIDVSLINGSSTNVILRATNNITFDANPFDAVNITTTGVGLTAEAYNNIFINQDMTTNGGDITLVADADSDGFGAIQGGSATILTLGGNVSLTAGGNILIGAIDTSNSGTGGGAITISHGGGAGNPFVVGGAITNGIVVNLTSGDFTFTDGSYDTDASQTSQGLQLYTVNLNIPPNINLIAANPAVTPSDPTPPDPTTDPATDPDAIDPDATDPDATDLALVDLVDDLDNFEDFEDFGDFDFFGDGDFGDFDDFGGDGPLSLELDGLGEEGPGEDGPGEGDDFGEFDGDSTFIENIRDLLGEGPGFDDFEGAFGEEFGDYLADGELSSGSTTKALSLSDARSNLRKIRTQTGITPAVVYFRFSPARISEAEPNTPAAEALQARFRQLQALQTQSLGTPSIDLKETNKEIRPTSSIDRPQPAANPGTGQPLGTWQLLEPSLDLSQGIEVEEQDTDELEVLMITPDGQPIRRQIPGATRSRVESVLRQFRQFVSDPSLAAQDQHLYLAPARQLYTWFITPLEETLGSEGIQNMLFSMSAGLRSMPLAALHDGKQFLIEKYSIGLSPSLSLTSMDYQDVRNLPLLAMGASEFTNQNPLPTVPVEMETISELWPGGSSQFLNQDFNREMLIRERQKTAYGIIHLATHAEFRGGSLGNSYIQFYGSDQLRLNQLQQLGWDDPPVELLTLSACQTALGDNEAELGFAGLAVQAGVKTAVASLWSVSDTATTALMTRFYSNLATTPIKAEALRQAQLALLRGEVTVEGNRLRGARGGQEVELPEASLSGLQSSNLSHPFYWAPFTMVVSPW